MRLARFGPHRHEKPALVDAQNRLRDASSLFRDWTPDFFQSEGLDALRRANLDTLPEVVPHARIGACVPRPGKLIGIGLNYSDHAAESGMPVPTEPVVFLKGTNTVVGPHDDILIPRGSQKTDWEVELGVVIGREARYLASPADAVACIAGYCVSHDVSERAFQLERGGQWTKGKSCDTFNPLGPWLVTADELPAPGSLDLRLWVNDELRQQGNTRTMIFNVPFIVHYLSQLMTLEPGD
ncbi:MAG TPA: fumarylacetoacetate hydrolase family protein, partial [Opitutus sp.]|nr:fumarylacetoacetate hydrolase family protein [Opitutus sp.]